MGLGNAVTRQGKLGSASAEPSLPRGLDRGPLPRRPPGPTRHSPVVFRKKSYAKSLAGSNELVVKPPRTKVCFLSKRPVESRDGPRLRATTLPHYLSPKGRLRPQRLFCKRNLIRSNRGQRLGNIRKTTKKHKYFRNRGLDGHKRYDTKVTPTPRPRSRLRAFSAGRW